MNKTISINPDLFSISSSKRSSRKREKKEKREHNQDIKIKPHKDKNKRLRKQHILRFLRQKQEDNYKKLVEGLKRLSGKGLAYWANQLIAGSKNHKNRTFKKVSDFNNSY